MSLPHLLLYPKGVKKKKSLIVLFTIINCSHYKLQQLSLHIQEQWIMDIPL